MTLLKLSGDYSFLKKFISPTVTSNRPFPIETGSPLILVFIENVPDNTDFISFLSTNSFCTRLKVSVPSVMFSVSVSSLFVNVTMQEDCISG